MELEATQLSQPRLISRNTVYTTSTTLEERKKELPGKRLPGTTRRQSCLCPSKRDRVGRSVDFLFFLTAFLLNPREREKND